MARLWVRNMEDHHRLNRGKCLYYGEDEDEWTEGRIQKRIGSGRVRGNRRWRQQRGRGERRWKEEGVLKKSVNVKVKEDNSAYLCWNSGRQNPISALSSLDPCWQGALKHGFQLCWVQSCISTNVMVKRLWVPNKWSLEENPSPTV